MSVKSAKATVKGLKTGKLYDFRVRAVSGKSKGAWSAGAHRWLVHQAGVRAASAKPGAVKVTWSKTPRVSAGYLVTVRYSKYGAAVAKHVVAAGKTSATITGLAPGKTAWVQVRCLREAGGATYASALTRSSKSIVRIAGKTSKVKAQSAGGQPARGALAAASF